MNPVLPTSWSSISWDFESLENYPSSKPLSVVVASELLLLQAEETGIILQYNFWIMESDKHCRDLWVCNRQNEAILQQLLAEGLLWSCSSTLPWKSSTDESPRSRKEKAVCATSARLPYGMFQTHYCLMTACRLGHQCGLNWNWSFTDFWITSWHGLRGVWNSSPHHCWSLAHKSYSKLKSINKRYFENIHKELKLFRAFIYTIHTQHSARCMVQLFCNSGSSLDDYKHVLEKAASSIF